MGRKKIRIYPSREEWETKIKEYVQENKESIRRYMLDKLGYEDIESLWEDEYHMKFGLDCGWVNLFPKNKEMAREWKLDNDGIPDSIWDASNIVYNTQSVTIKSIIMYKVVEDMGIENEFSIVERLD